MRAGITRLMTYAKKFGAFALAGYSVAIDKLEVWLKFLNNTKFSSFLGEIERSPLARMVAFLLILATFIQISVDFDDRVDERRMRQEERRANDEERIARAWSALTTFASGNSGKADAIETLLNAGVSLEGIDISCETMKAGWNENNMECQRPIILRGIMKREHSNLGISLVKRQNKTGFFSVDDECFDKYPSLINYNKTTNQMKFNGAKLAGVDFSGSIIANADFSGADLRGAIFNDTFIINSVFDDANLLGAKFNKSVIFNSKFNIKSNFDFNIRKYEQFLKAGKLHKNSKIVPIEFEDSKIFLSTFVVQEKGNGFIGFRNVSARFNNFLLDPNEFDLSESFAPMFVDSSEVECSIIESGSRLRFRDVDISGSYFSRIKVNRNDDVSTTLYGFNFPLWETDNGNVEISGPVVNGRRIDSYRAYFSEEKPPAGHLSKTNIYPCKSLPYKKDDEYSFDKYNYDIAIKYCQS